MIRFLHLSDIHLTRENLDNDWKAGGILRKLLHFIQDTPPLDLIFITGDLANTGGDPKANSPETFHLSDYGACKEFLDKLVTAARLPGPEYVWLVPGNHDVYGPYGRRLQRSLETEEDADNFFSSIEEREPFLKKFDPFLYFLELFQPKCRLAKGDVVREPDVINLRGAKIGILPLNSAWFSLPDDADRGKLFVGHRLLVDRAKMLHVYEPRIVIALLHHPNNYLSDEEKEFRHALIENCHIVLRGHLHSLETQIIGTGETQIIGTGIEQVIDVTAGATYVAEPKGPKRVFLGELDPDTCNLNLCAYKPSDRGNTWIEENDAFSGKSCKRFGLIQSPPPPPECHSIPYSSPEYVGQFKWKEDLLAWFLGNGAVRNGAYYICPEKAIEQLVNHLLKILRHIEDNPRLASQGKSIQYLASEILVRLSSPQAVASRCANEAALLGLLDEETTEKRLDSEFSNRWSKGWRDQHRIILQLFTKGLHNQLSHLFLLPSVNTTDLLSINGYAQLLLSSRLHGEGRYKQAIDLIDSSPASSCCIGLYVKGQCLRQLGEIDMALPIYERLMRDLDKPFVCPITSDQICMCNRDLFESELKRAVGVIYRKHKNYAKAREYFEQALHALYRVDISSTPTCRSTLNSLCGYYEKQRLRVAADFHFGYGYFLYETWDSKSSPNELDMAAKQFETARSFLQDCDTIWDSPTTRLGIIRLMQNNPNAKSLLNEAYMLCKESDVKSNRSAPLSQALCALGLAVIDIERNREPPFKPLDELTLAVNIDPPLSNGPIECHIADAQKILKACTRKESISLVEGYIDKLNSERNKISTR